MSTHAQYYIYTGTYTPADEEAIHWLLFDAVIGKLERAGGISGVDNPSYLTLDPVRNKLFAVSETAGGAVVSYACDPATGRLTAVNRQPSHGDAPCHIQVDGSGKWLLAVNYMSGTVNLYPIDDHGRIGSLADQIQHAGGSVRSPRQDGPHPHSIWNIPGTMLWLVPDLGNDTLCVYRLDAERGKLVFTHKHAVESGAGPRHVAFHPSLTIVYVIEELSSAISVYAVTADQGTLHPLQTISTLPRDYTGDNTCADIHISASGEFLYGSNRGHDSIAAFRIDGEGKLRLIGHGSTMGQSPRNFTLVPDSPYLLAANQLSDSVVVMRIADNGVPAYDGQTLQVNKPVCLKVLPATISL